MRGKWKWHGSKAMIIHRNGANVRGSCGMFGLWENSRCSCSHQQELLYWGVFFCIVKAVSCVEIMAHTWLLCFSSGLLLCFMQLLALMAGRIFDWDLKLRACLEERKMGKTMVWLQKINGKELTAPMETQFEYKKINNNLIVCSRLKEATEYFCFWSTNSWEEKKKEKNLKHYTLFFVPSQPMTKEKWVATSSAHRRNDMK